MAETLTPVMDEIQPNPQVISQYAKIYDIFKEAYDVFVPLYDKIASI
jgi:sugar (pentulose or hexulose) kinase